MEGWEYLDDDGTALYDLVAVLNVQFNDERVQTQLDSNTRRIETRCRNRLAAQTKGMLELWLRLIYKLIQSV